MLISAILMNIGYMFRPEINVEFEARQLGMIYPSEIKALDTD